MGAGRDRRTRTATSTSHGTAIAMATTTSSSAGSVPDGTPDAIEQVTKSPRFEAILRWLSMVRIASGWPGTNPARTGARTGPTKIFTAPPVLYANRSIRVAMKDGGDWKEGPDFSAAVPDRLRRYWQLPHLPADSNGRIWALFQMRTSALNNREDFWCNGGLWDLYLTTVENGVWQPADDDLRFHRPSRDAGADCRAGPRVFMTWALDGRQFGKIVPGFQGATMVHYDVDMASASRTGASGQVECAVHAARNAARCTGRPNRMRRRMSRAFAATA